MSKRRVGKSETLRQDGLEDKRTAEARHAGVVDRQSFSDASQQVSRIADEGVENPDPLMDCDEIAKYLGLERTHKHPEQAVRHLCRTKKLESTKICGRTKSRLSWVERYIQKGRKI